jgi:hypothetical protein
MLLRYLLIAGFLLGPGAAAQAQDVAQPRDSVVERKVKGQAGRDVRIGAYVNIKPDCTTGPLPTLRLKEPPANGKVTVRQMRVQATNVRQCLAVEVPAFVAFYRSSPGFSGQDSALIEIVSPSGKVQLQRIILTVEKPTARQEI